MGVLRAAAARIAEGIHLGGYNLYLLRSLKRPEWIYKRPGAIPSCSLTFTPSDPSSAENVAICERIIAAYHLGLTHRDSLDVSVLWSSTIQRDYGELLAAVTERDASRLARYFASMFRQRCLHGISTAELYRMGEAGLGSRIWSLKFLDDLVSLAEALGVVRAETPEQGELGYAFRQYGLDALLERIEAALAIRASFPEVAGAYGYRVGDRLLTMEAPEHIYAAWRMKQAIGGYLAGESAASPRIVEIGAGFGGSAFWLMQLRNLEIESYSIIDLPTTNLMQSYFMARVFGSEAVSFYGESPAKIRVLPTHAVESLSNVNFLINENSMPEMTEAAVAGYIQWAKQNLRGVFFSYNQEAYSPIAGVPQVLVPEIVRTVGGFRLLSRNASWVRRGYVEELYGREDGDDATVMVGAGSRSVERQP